MKKIPLTKGKFAIVDDEDYPYLIRFSWVISRVSKNIELAMAHLAGGGKIYMHQLLMKNNHGYQISHKNGNVLDNRKENLISIHVNNRVQRGRKKKGLSSKYKGVYFMLKRKRNPWCAYITNNYRRIHIGVFHTEKEAAKAYNAKARELYGELAYQNIIN